MSMSQFVLIVSCAFQPVLCLLWILLKVDWVCLFESNSNSRIFFGGVAARAYESR